MDLSFYKNAIKNFPEFLKESLSLKSDVSSLFKNIENIISFDNSYIFFTNPDSLVLKYKSENTEILDIDEAFICGDKFKKILFSENILAFNSKDKFVNFLGLDKNFNSFLMVKLLIRETVFGFVLLCKNEQDFYDAEIFDIARSLGYAISYSIKDFELSKVFKLQLQSLQKGILDTSTSYKDVLVQNEKILAEDKIKSEFLANVSHELRTPLNSIICFSDALKQDYFGRLNEKQYEYVNEINISGIHLLGMINEILDMSKIEANAMKLNKMEYEVSRSIDEVLNVVMPLAKKKKIELIKKINNEVLIFADYQKINQILYNLLSNAIKFTPENGKIVVSTNVTKKSFKISVKDSGCGIPEADYDRIFDKFVQLDNVKMNSVSSTGLGLTIVKDFVKMHDGAITVKSKIGAGTEFLISIPKVFDKKSEV